LSGHIRGSSLARQPRDRVSDGKIPKL
jgi:hypothetical protein